MKLDHLISTVPCLCWQMCVPVILLDKLSLAELYVRDHPDLQQRLVTLLDSWCDPNFNIQALLR